MYPLQIHVTKHVVTHVDSLDDQPPKYTDFYNNSNLNYPETPSAPHPQCTTFSDSISLGSDLDSDSKSAHLDLELPAGHTIICHPTEPGIYTVARPNTLARLLFLFGFLFPGFWIVGSIILFMSLRPTPDWESGKSPIQIERTFKIIRQIELKPVPFNNIVDWKGLYFFRWAHRCFYALFIEVVIIIVISILLKSRLVHL